MEGRGEILTPVPALPHLPMLLVNPGVAVPTKDVFAALDERRGTEMTLPRGRFSDLADLLRFLETTGNDLEAPAHRPATGDRRGAGRLKSASGRTVHAHVRLGRDLFRILCRTMTAARRAAKRICWKQTSSGLVDRRPSFVPETGIDRIEECPAATSARRRMEL